jgi:hypothetical protein
MPQKVERSRAHTVSPLGPTITDKVTTPVVLIVFNRPEQTRKVLESISEARPEHLIVIADGPRIGRSADLVAVRETRELFDALPWSCSVERVFSKTNLGVRERILTGLDDVFSKYERAIIIEDDCLPSPDFLFFAQAILERYEENNQIGLVGGFNNGASVWSSSKYFFSRFPEIWGWATWAHTWHDFRDAPLASGWSKEEASEAIKHVESRIAQRRLSRLSSLNKSISTWDIDFALHLVNRELLTALPATNLITNIGFGDSATHTRIEPLGLIRTRGRVTWPLVETEVVKPRKFQYAMEILISVTRANARLFMHPCKSTSWLLQAYRLWLAKREVA